MRLPVRCADEVTNAAWCACHSGQRAAAGHLLDRDADPDWIGHDGLTPIDAARRSYADDVVDWLGRRGARSHEELEQNGPGDQTP